MLHVCVYNQDPNAVSDLKRHIEELNFVRLVAEVDGPDALADTLREGLVNLIFFHLDPDPDPIIRVIDDVSARYPELAMIAVSHRSDPESILLPMRAGCDQFVCEPIDSADFSSAVARAASRRLSGVHKSRCICVTGASGGAGTTSIACNLALEIGSLVQRDCALVDLDLQFGDVAMNFDCQPRYNIYDLAESGSELDQEVLSSTLTSLPCNVALLGRPDQIEQHEGIGSDLVHRVIEILATAYENVVIDVPGRFDARTTAAFEQADTVLIVCQLLVTSIRNARRSMDYLQRLGVSEERIEVVVNRYDGRSRGLTKKDLEDVIQKPIFASVPNDYQFIARSIDVGKPIAAVESSNPVRVAIRRLACSIVHDNAADAAGSDDASAGFLSRLLSKYHVTRASTPTGVTKCSQAARAARSRSGRP